jgi:hypothetical protein
MRDEMAMPAASSFALLMRLPVESCSMAVAKKRSLTVKALAATRDLTLVLITDMIYLLKDEKID